MKKKKKQKMTTEEMVRQEIARFSARMYRLHKIIITDVQYDIPGEEMGIMGNIQAFFEDSLNYQKGE